ncbi:MAG: hypothetical protein HC828_14540 [Blastochloris sp.]|nr:hypothetical protein [Blastochloris sp.]
MMEIADIPTLPSYEARYEAITVDCYNDDEVLSSFHVYLSDALRPPFAGLWGAPDMERLPVTVLGIGDDFDAEGVRLRVRLADGDVQDVLADQLWSVETSGINATVLDDYRRFVTEGGLPFDETEEDWDDEN